MTSLSEHFWRKCILCGHYYRSKRVERKNSGNVKYSYSLGCAICTYREKKRVYYNQLLFDLNNQIHKNGEWVESSDESKVRKRLSRTIVTMYKELGPVTAEDLFYRAYDKYWYSNYFTQASLKP